MSHKDAEAGQYIDAEAERFFTKNFDPVEDTTLKASFMSPPLPRGQAYTIPSFCKTEETLAGHVFEVDNTPGNPRIKRFHKTGSFDEYDFRGGFTQVIQGNEWHMVIRDQEISVGGKVRINVMSDVDMIVGGDYNVVVHGDYNLSVKGDMRTRIDGADMKEVTGDICMNTGQNYQLVVDSDYFQKVKGNYDRQVLESYSEMVGGNMTSHVMMNKHVSTILSQNYSAGINFVAGAILYTELSAGGGGKMAQSSYQMWPTNISQWAPVSILNESTFLNSTTTTLGNIEQSAQNSIYQNAILGSITSQAFGGVSQRSTAGAITQSAGTNITQAAGMSIMRMSNLSIQDYTRGSMLTNVPFGMNVTNNYSEVTRNTLWSLEESILGAKTLRAPIGNIFVDAPITYVSSAVISAPIASTIVRKLTSYTDVTTTLVSLNSHFHLFSGDGVRTSRPFGGGRPSVAPPFPNLALYYASFLRASMLMKSLFMNNTAMIMTQSAADFVNKVGITSTVLSKITSPIGAASAVIGNAAGNVIGTIKKGITAGVIGLGKGVKALGAALFRG